MRLFRWSWIPLVLVLAWLYAEVWRFAPLEPTRPYVYRQFVPLLALLLVWLTGMDRRPAVVLVVIGCALGFAFAMRYLYVVFHEKD